MRSPIIKSASLWLPVLAWMGVIFYFSSIPDLRSPFEWDLLYRKLAHAAEYLVLAVLSARALRGSGLSRAACLVLGFLIAAGYAVTDEYHQSFVPGRTASTRDVLIDSTGALLGALAGLFLYKAKTGNIKTATESS